MTRSQIYKDRVESLPEISDQEFLAESHFIPSVSTINSVLPQNNKHEIEDLLSYCQTRIRL